MPRALEDGLVLGVSAIREKAKGIELDVGGRGDKSKRERAHRELHIPTSGFVMPSRR